MQGKEHELHHTAKFRTTPLPAGGRPAPLSEVAGWHVKVARHTEQLIDDLPYVQILDAPVPQMVDSAMDFFRRLDMPVPEQVIDVPMISSSSCPSGAVLNEPQVVEQLVEVPTLLSVAVLQQRTAEQLAYIPVPRGRGQGFLAEQSSTAISSSSKRISERTVERIVDISPGGGLGHGSSSSAGPADEDFYWGFFALFPSGKKVRHDLHTRGRHCLRTRAHGHRQLMTCQWAVWRSRRRGGRRPSSKRLRLWRGLGCYRTW